MEKVTIILLAGGEASRYKNSFKSLTKRHQDKLLSKKADASLLEFVCAELNPLGNIIVVTRGDRRQQQYSDLLKANRVTVISENFKKSIGPIGGIYSALNLCKKDQTKIIIPANLPNLKKDIIAELITQSSQSKLFDLISVVHPNGQIENLVLISPNRTLLENSRFLIDQEIYRVSSLIRLTSKKRFINSVFLKGGDGSIVFRDLDFQGIKPEFKPIDNPKINSPYIDFGLNIETEQNQKDPSILYRQSLDFRKEKRKSHEKSLLLEEAKIYRNVGLLSLALHCLLDAYKIAKNPEIKDQIHTLLMQL